MLTLSTAKARGAKPAKVTELHGAGKSNYPTPIDVRLSSNAAHGTHIDRNERTYRRETVSQE